MSVKISRGMREQGIVVGNVYDKYTSNNPVVKWIMRGYESDLSDLVAIASPQAIHEVGCGEGYWVLRWAEQGISARGCDFSRKAIDLAQENAVKRGLCPSIFVTRSIYDLDPNQDTEDLVICCEVLEHLDDPEAGLRALQRVVNRHLILSVPMEPMWRILNMVRGKYVWYWGNTPGHLQHWSKNDFIRLVSQYFHVVQVRSPLPWTMLLCRPFVYKD